MNAARAPLPPLPKLFAPHDTEAEAEAYANRFSNALAEFRDGAWRVRRFATKDEVRETGHEPCAILATPSMLLGLDKQPDEKLAQYYVANKPSAQRAAPPVRVATGDDGTPKTGSVATCRAILAEQPDIERAAFVALAVEQGVLEATAKIQYGRIKRATEG